MTSMHVVNDVLESDGVPRCARNDSASWKEKGGAAVGGETTNRCPAERKLHFRSFPSLNLQFNQSLNVPDCHLSILRRAGRGHY
jgi:hypothetical protein